MKIKVTSVGEPWKATPESDALYTIHIEGHGEPQKTFDAALAVVGEHEAEEYQSKAGKPYWRTPKASGAFQRAAGGVKKFEADPKKLDQDKTLTIATNQSIQRQVAYKGVIDLIAADKIDINAMYDYFGYSMELLSNPDWRAVVEPRTPISTEDALGITGGELVPTDDEVGELDEVPS